MKKSCIILMALWIGTAGCEDDEPASEKSAPDPAASSKGMQEQADAPVKKLMAGHFEKAWKARAAIIRGDFEEAKQGMKWLSEYREEDDAVPQDLQPTLARMQESAGQFLEADELAEAGQAFAQTLTHCGECHDKVEGGPEFDPPPPPEGDSVAVHMQRHRWAADRMWEGLVGARPEAFRKGAQALIDTEFRTDELPGADEDPERIEALAQHVHELAREGVEAEDTEAAITIYGRFIASCAGCHRLTGGGPGADRPSPSSLVNP